MATYPAAPSCRSHLNALWAATSLAAAILSGLAPVAAGAAPAEKAEAPVSVPAELLERPLPLRQGIGNSHEDVSTGSREAQAFYDQGLNYLEAYVWIEAARSFHQALRLDPDLAMAYVGLSRAYSGLGDRVAAEKSLLEAKPLSSRVSPREQRRISIREKQLEAMKNIKDVRKFDAYKKAIDDALRAECDPELWLLRGNAEEPDASGRGQYGTETSIIYYHHVLTLYPDYASAHHFLTHTYEGLGQTDSALAHGEAYARLAPAIPHAAHMWGHTLRHAGRVSEAIAQFEKADSLESAYLHAENIDPKYDWHYAHNLALLATINRGEETKVASKEPSNGADRRPKDETGTRTYGSVSAGPAGTAR